MNDATYQIFQDGQIYKVRITRLGNFIQEAEGFSSYGDAAAWVAQAQRLEENKGSQQVSTSVSYLRVV